MMHDNYTGHMICHMIILHTNLCWYNKLLCHMICHMTSGDPSGECDEVSSPHAVCSGCCLCHCLSCQPTICHIWLPSLWLSHQRYSTVVTLSLMHFLLVCACQFFFFCTIVTSKTTPPPPPSLSLSLSLSLTLRVCVSEPAWRCVL